jgi:magnesium transporter
MKVFTVTTVLMLPATVILGFYGTNFETLPIFELPNGFIAMAVMLLAIPMLMLLGFRRRRWI